MDLRRVTTFQSQQCPLPQQQHDQVQAFFPLVSTRELLATIAKKPSHTKDECRKLKKKEEQKHNEGRNTKKEYPKCPTCDKINHPAERCWKGAGAHLKPKNLKFDDCQPEGMSASPREPNNKQPALILKNPKN